MKYDAIVIGFGKGGKTMAGALAAQGKKVAMVEKDSKMYGGTCINVGCIPSKSLVRSAQLSELAGGGFEEKGRRFKAAMAEKIRLTDMLRGKNYGKLADSPNVTVYDGLGSFVSNTQVKVTGADGAETLLEAEKIFINTGSTSFVPPIPGVKDNPFVYTSNEMLSLENLPRHLVIIGGGYIGLEFASFYTSFGSAVTVVQIEDEFIPREDRDIAQAIQKSFEDRGVKFAFAASTTAINHDGKQAQVHYTIDGVETVLDADAVLIATGRKPNVEGLNVEAAGVTLTPRSAIAVDDHLKTTADNIWAMGDVAGGLQFTYVSLDDYRIVLPQVYGQAKRSVAARQNVPYSVFIAPSFSRVGLNEKEALDGGHKIVVAKMPAAAVPKAQVLKNPTGLLKAIVDADTHKILGAMLFCEESYEMINTVKLAMDLDADYTVLRDQIFTHPTMSEALNDLFGMVKL